MHTRPRICALIASRNRPDLVDDMVARLTANTSLDIDFVVVECGTEAAKMSRHSSLWYADEPFRGKCYGHNLALAEARQRAAQAGVDYDYYWVLMNDVVFDDGVDAARLLVDTMEREERLAILSPTNADGAYPACARRPGGGWRAVTTCDYLGFMMRADALDEVGFLNPAFRYCWGAIHELAYKLYRAGWCVGYSDDVTYQHLGGTTYGAPGTNTISRDEYQELARRFANDYFVTEYGDDWHSDFFAATRGHDIEIDTFSMHRELWSGGAFRAAASTLSREERELTPPGAVATNGTQRVRLHLGCGRDRREGWVNVDANPAVQPDVVAQVDQLTSFGDGSVDVIEANHLFEHLMHHEAIAALKEWRRVLKPDGELYLELPDLAACLRILGRYTDDNGCDLGLTGVYGWLPDIARDGLWQQHKWGWTREALEQALVGVGFGSVDFGPITQDWRPAAKYGRDMRVRARVAARAAVRDVDAAPALAGRSTDGFGASGVERRAPVEAPVQPSGQVASQAVPQAAPQVAAQAAPAVANSAQEAPESIALFAWPDYGSDAELDYLFTEFGAPLADGRGALMLRYDASVDGDRDAVLARLDAACARQLGERPLDVVLLDQPFSGEDWKRVGAVAAASIVMPSSQADQRRFAIASVGARLVSRFDQVGGMQAA